MWSKKIAGYIPYWDKNCAGPILKEIISKWEWRQRRLTLWVWYLGIVALLSETNVPEMKDGGDKSQNVRFIMLRQSHHRHGVLNTKDTEKRIKNTNFKC